MIDSTGKSSFPSDEEQTQIPLHTASASQGGASADEEWIEEINPDEERALARRRNVRFGLGLVCAFAIGIGVGGWGARQRAKANQVIASVNGQSINQDSFYHLLENKDGVETLQKMAGSLLQQQYAKKMGVMPTPAEVEARYKQISSRPHFGEYLARTRMSVEDVKEGLKTEMAVNNVVAKTAGLTEADVRDFYRKQSDPSTPNARFYTPQSVVIAIISNHSKEIAQHALGELQKGGDFAAVATKYSSDQSKEHGGVLAPIVRGRGLYTKLPGFEDLAFNMEPGQQVGPHQFGPVWCIIRCVEKKPAETKTFDEVAYECKAEAAAAKLSAPERAKLRDNFIQYHQNANIHAFWVQYKNVLGGK